MSYYNNMINIIIDLMMENNPDVELIRNHFDLMVNKFGKILTYNHIKDPYKKAYNQLLKLMQIKLNKRKINIEIHNYIPKCNSIYIVQYV